MATDKPAAATGSEWTPINLADRDRMLTELQETGRIAWPNGWSLWHLNDLVETLGIDPKHVMVMKTDVVVPRGD